MDRRVLEYNVAAALFSAAFLFGISPADAYTYSGGTVTVDQVVEDENDLVVTGRANLTCNTIQPNKRINKETIIESNAFNIIMDDEGVVSGGGTSHISTKKMIENIPNMMNDSMYTDFLTIFDNITCSEVEKRVNNFNSKYKAQIKSNMGNSTSSSGLNRLKSQFSIKESKISFTNFYIPPSPGVPVGWAFSTEEAGKTTYSELIPTIERVSITVSNNSTLTSKTNVKTDKAINVTGNSFLKAASSISGGDVYSDKAIISTTKDQGESIITPGNITATGALKSDTYVGAWSGAVSGKTVYSGGDVVSANSIKAGGLAKGKVLNVSAINAASASITGNQSISGVFTATGQAKLNGGAALGNKKISSLSAGTLSATSTEAVNGAQLNTIKQKLATAGKTYTAGSDIGITAANAISVTKSGVVDKGNTGIVTGGTVYKITSALNQSLDSLKASVSGHQSTLTTLSQGLSDLKSSVTNINSSVASATKNLSAQLTNRLQSDLGNLSDDGKNVIRNMVSSTLKSMSSMSISDAGKSASAIATYEAANDVEDDSLADICTGLDSKVTRGDFDLVSTTVASNTKSVDLNSSSIQKNVGDIAGLKESKADADGGNISVDGYAKRLGVGTVEAGNAGLVTGDTVYAALDKKADYGYVAGGLGIVSSELDAMSQRMTCDLNRVGTGASALTGLHPTGYDASDKLSFAYGGGHYKNTNTSALGAFYHPNEKTMVSLAGTIGNTDAMLSAGVSVKVGIGNHVSKVMVTPKMFSAQEATNQDMKDHLDTQAERIRQIELALQNR